ncbi:MAG: hypothetical protein J0H07_32820 [Sphingobacteriales bacterium]|nr:hypothetical protein [Sphingobacteriales bacterium]
MLSLKAQHPITYIFEKPAIDSLQNGINWFEKMYHKPIKNLKIYAIVVEKDASIEIYLQEYSPIHFPGLLDVIKSSNRRIKIKDGLFIPVVFPCDVHSTQLQQDKIGMLPFSGYYLRIVYENLKLKNVETRMLF